MESSKSVLFPSEMLVEMEIEDTFFPTNSKQIGIAVLSHFQESAYIMRIYQLIHNNESDSFEPIQELASFSFSSKEHFDDFLKMLPNMTGLEMLMLLNPLFPGDDLLSH